MFAKVKRSITVRLITVLVSLSVLTGGFLAGSAQATVSSNGIVMPIKTVTPGAVDESITQENIKSTICVVGYTKTVRPPVSYTGALKAKQLRSTYKRYNNTNNKDFEEDHLIPLSIGGSPKSVLNLWPQPYYDTKGAYLKDKVELKLHSLVCNGKVSLVEAQRAIAVDWYAAYIKYMKY